jgi:hypothetical protein
MKREELLVLIEELTGKPVRIIKSDECTLHTLLDRFLNKKNLDLNRNEFNEILLLCNKDRISEGFFNFFFRRTIKKKKLTLSEIKIGVNNFRLYAMWVYGNFIFAYRKLSRLSEKKIKKELKEYLRDPEKLENDFIKRPSALERIFPIERKFTHFVGYLSGKTIEVEWNTAKILKKFFEVWNGKEKDFLQDWANYIKINEIEKKEKLIKDSSSQILAKFYEYNHHADLRKFKGFIGNSIKSLEKVKKVYEEIRKKAELNTDIYLTWDYLDVYLATSMRDKYEYETFYDFTRKLFKNKKLSRLKLRYFDPTQSFEQNRTDKGLIEGLMLKRAKCTIYSVQESDTLGKDSELASTLAQGKPVIAFIPEIDIDKHVRFIKKQSLNFIYNKIDLLRGEFRGYQTLNKLRDWLIKSKLRTFKIDPNNPESFRKFIFDTSNAILKISSKNIWESIELSPEQLRDIKKTLGMDFVIICNFIAIADKAFYDRRAYIIQETHPLGIQINLATGVANGVLLVRTIKDCANLLDKILTNRLEFLLECNPNSTYSCLKEKISQSIYRIVTKDQRLTNSFWNFYLSKEEDEEKEEEEERCQV